MRAHHFLAAIALVGLAAYTSIAEARGRGHGGGGTGGGTVSNEEFVGPFTSWQNVKNAPYSCVGDGVANDTACLQKALNSLGSSTPTIYLPAGTYKISDVLTTATAGSGASSITVASGAGIVAGMLVTGVNLPASDYVDPSYTPGSTTVPLTVNTAGSLSATPVTFTMAITSQQYVNVIGADPATTTLLWAGSSGGTMLYVDGVAYSRFDRLTFNGQGNPVIAVDQSKGPGGFFDAVNEYADDVFENVGTGLHCGFGAGGGCADTAVLRGQFLNNTTIGIVEGNYNALGMFVWYSLFQNNAIGIGNAVARGAGNFIAYNNIFQNSSFADIAIGNPGGYMSFRYNYSTGSNRFLNTGPVCSPNNITVQGNTILDTTSSLSVSQQDLAPLVFVDNVVRSGSGVSTGPVVQVGWNGVCGGNLFSFGNTFTASSPTIAYNSSHSHAILDQVVSRGTVNPVAPTLPGTPPNLGRTIYEPSALTGAAIQTAINSAAALCANNVAHIPAGAYNVSATITVPANCAVQIIGDGGHSALNWSTGVGGSPVLKLLGPSKATLRDFLVDGNTNVADGIEVDTADQPGSRVFGEQLVSVNSHISLFVDALDYTNVELHDLNHGHTLPIGNTTSVTVTGGTQAALGNWLGGVTNIFAGDSSANYIAYGVSTGAHLAVLDTWYDAGGGSGAAEIASATGASTFTYAGGTLYLPDANPTVVSLNNFLGTGALVELNTIGNIHLTGSGSGAQVLGLGLIGPSTTFFSDTTSPAVTFEFLNGLTTASPPPGTGAAELPEIGCCNTPFLTTTLNQMRTAQPSIPTPLPPGVTDARFYRVFVQSANTGVHLKAP